MNSEGKDNPTTTCKLSSNNCDWIYFLTFSLQKAIMQIFSIPCTVFNCASENNFC